LRLADNNPANVAGGFTKRFHGAQNARDHVLRQAHDPILVIKNYRNMIPVFSLVRIAYTLKPS
jgi:hypothetical protein